MASEVDQTEGLPRLYADTGFWGMIATQFLGAFNDNLFKQLVLLLCVEEAIRDRSRDYQGLATILFAAPFILFSGFAGFLADRYSKRQTVVLCKVAEVLVMLGGMAAFAWGSLSWLLAVLFLMGTHSAFFGPAKYGILPEMLRHRDLPRANGIMLMTTFLAIILGFSGAGILKDWLVGRLAIASAVCALIAVVGTLTAMLVRRTPVAHPGLRFEISSLAINADTRRAIGADRVLLRALLATSLFWLVGGIVYPPAVNAVGKLQLRLPDTQIGLLAACTGVGIAIGCVAAGRLSHQRVDPRLVRAGAWGLVAVLAVLALPQARSYREEMIFRKLASLVGTTDPAWLESDSPRDRLLVYQRIGRTTRIDESARTWLIVSQVLEIAADPDDLAGELREHGEPDLALLLETDPARFQELYEMGWRLFHDPLDWLRLTWRTALGLVLVGLFAGFFTVPLQVFLQARAPEDQKGRVIGAMNLLNWIGIAVSGLVYTWANQILAALRLPPSSMFLVAALLLVPVAIWYRPPKHDLS